MIPQFLIIPDSSTHTTELKEVLSRVDPSSVRSFKCFMPSTKYIEVDMDIQENYHWHSFAPVGFWDSVSETALRLLNLESKDIYELETLEKVIDERSLFIKN